MTTTPPDQPTFSQASLQDYLTCARLYHLRDVEHLSWPAVQSEPALEAELHIQQGADFHQLVRQYYLGIPVETLTPLANGERLAAWWSTFLEMVHQIPELDIQQPQFRRFAELECMAPFPGFRLVAKYDLIVIDSDGRAGIFDWKTNRKRPSREKLAGMMQTRVYPLVLSLSGRRFNRGRDISPEKIEMQYLFMDDPLQPERFAYNTAQRENDARQIQTLVNEILSTPEDGFTKTTDETRCRFCLYRSYCDRGSAAGDFREAEAVTETPLDIDFDNLPEIEI